MRRNIPIVLLVFFILAFFIFLLPKDFFAPGLIGFVQRVFATPKAWFYRAQVGNAEESELAKQNKILIAKLVNFEKLKQDNTALRSQFQETQINPQKLLPVRIVGFLGQPGYPTALVVDAGNMTGIKKGMIAILGKNFVGKVQRVTPQYAELLLPTATNFSMLAVTTRNNASGIVNGGGDVLLLNNVSITDTLSKSDIVMTKGEIDPQGDGATPGYIFGTITKVDKNDTRPFQSGIINPSLNYAKLSSIFIVVK